jgi:hypothetical protein
MRNGPLGDATKRPCVSRLRLGIVKVWVRVYVGAFCLGHSEEKTHTSGFRPSP